MAPKNADIPHGSSGFEIALELLGFLGKVIDAGAKGQLEEERLPKLGTKSGFESWVGEGEWLGGPLAAV